MLNKSDIIRFNYSTLGMCSLYKINLNEILSLIFSKTIQIQLSKGQYLEYVNISENIKSLKGSIIIKKI